MPKLLTTLLLCVLLTSCVTEKKVNRWLNEHETEAAGYCADNFPPDTVTKTVVENIDSAGYFDAYMGMSTYADSLFWRLDSMKRNATPERPYRLNMDSLRKAVDKEIRKRLKPCIDTVKVVTNTVIDRAREVQLSGKLNEKDGTISARDKRITELEGKVKSKNKWVWMFWGLVVLIVGYTVLKLRFKLPI
jgi:hypothetical protein